MFRAKGGPRCASGGSGAVLRPTAEMEPVLPFVGDPDRLLVMSMSDEIEPPLDGGETVDAPRGQRTFDPFSPSSAKQNHPAPLGHLRVLVSWCFRNDRVTPLASRRATRTCAPDDGRDQVQDNGIPMDSTLLEHPHHAPPSPLPQPHPDIHVPLGSEGLPAAWAFNRWALCRTMMAGFGAPEPR